MADTASLHPIVVVTGQFLTFAGIAVAAWFGYRASVHAKEAKSQATQANDAVNHVHPGGDRLFDIVSDTRKQVSDLNEWKDRWDGLPEQLNSADSLVTHFAVIDDRIITTTDAVSRKVDQLDRSNQAQHQEIVRVLNEHIADEAPRIAALADSLAAMETREEAKTRTTDLVDQIDSDAIDRDRTS